jgi:uncharacterized protein (DUF1330 family)
MPKGYVITRVDITNPDAYARYAAAATKAIADHGGKPLACGSEALRAKRGRATLCSNSKAMTRRIAIFIPSNTRRRGFARRRAEIETKRSRVTCQGYGIVHIDVRDPEVWQA